MALPYKRSFQNGRQSDQLFNDELHEIIELVRHLAYQPQNETDSPDGKVSGSLWIDPNTNEAKRYNATLKTWEPVYGNQLKLITHIADEIMPDNPIIGQLWIQNGVLMWWDGLKWDAARTLLQDGAKFSLAAFEDFIFSSPLSATDNFVTTGNGESAQYIVPRFDIDRVFINNKLYNKATKLNAISMEIKKKDIENKRLSLVHINSGKLTNIKKRLIKVDKKNAKIMIPASNTEFYGFQKDNPYGDFLYPYDDEKKLNGYSIIEGGISLPYSLAQNYEYILAITYEFSWMRSTGEFTKTNAADANNKNFIYNGKAPYTFFVEGFALSNEDYVMDSLSQTFEVKNDSVKDLEVLAMRTLKPEEGIITSQDLNNICYIRPHNRYYSPLLFVNGMAFHPRLNDITYDDEEFTVKNAKRGMEWRAIELWDEEHEYDMFEDTGIISELDKDGNPIILFNTVHIKPEDNIILFIDGILIRTEEITRNNEEGYLTVNGLYYNLNDPMDYILLKDRYHFLYSSDKVYAALQLPVFDESLVYVDGSLVCNEEAIREFKSQEDTIIIDQPLHDEIKEFIDYNNSDKHGLFSYNAIRKKWEKLNPQEKTECENILKFYGNSYKALKFNHELKDILDKIDIFVYRYANSIEHVLEIYNVDIENQRRVEVPAGFQYGNNQLRVWCDGVRIYPDTAKYPGIVEGKNGLYFELPETYTGHVTYIIERTEAGLNKSANMEVLDHTNLKSGYVNVYTTNDNMYPGRTSVYLNGIRLASEDYVIYDNHTLLINNDTPLTGLPSN